MPVKQEILELHHSEKWAELDEALDEYHQVARRFYSYGLAVCFDEEILSAYLDLQRRKGERDYANDYESLVPHQHRLPVAITNK